LLEEISNSFQNSRQHWLFWPSVFIVLQIIVYNFLFSTNGYLAYLENIRLKNELSSEIENLEQQKKELEQHLGQIRDDETALQLLSPEMLLYDDNVIILKFLDENRTTGPEKQKGLNLNLLQRFYIFAGSILLLVTTILFYRKREIHENN